jgi:hypothetical protein
LFAKHYVEDEQLTLDSPTPVRIGDRKTMYSHGTANVTINLGTHKVKKRMLVFDTTAFQAILGLDYLNKPTVAGMLMRPARLVVNREFVSSSRRPTTAPSP